MLKSGNSTWSLKEKNLTADQSITYTPKITNQLLDKDSTPSQTDNYTGYVDSVGKLTDLIDETPITVDIAKVGLPLGTEGASISVVRGYCAERRLADNTRSITAMSFAADGRLFLALDSYSIKNQDLSLLTAPYHPSRAVSVYDTLGRFIEYEILSNSSRITGLYFYNGVLYISRAGEIGRIPDGGEYETLAEGFAVNGQIFHANNGIVIVDEWIYLATGGMYDGYVDAPLGSSDLVDEQRVQNIVANNNPYAARIIRAPLKRLQIERSIDVFSTVAIGVRNPYGITSDPDDRIWFTDNGASGIIHEFKAGDEVNLLETKTLHMDSPLLHYGFPLMLYNLFPKQYVPPIISLQNSAAPTGITWAYGTIFFAQYGRDPGVYRVDYDMVGNAVANRVVDAWPVIALATAPDGALWIGMGDGGLYKLTLGC